MKTNTNYFRFGKYSWIGILLINLLITKATMAQFNFQHTYGASGDDFGRYAIETDSGYKFAGYSLSLGVGGENILYGEVDACGFLIDSKIMGGTADDRANALIELPSGNILLFGQTASYGAGLLDMYAVLINTPTGTNVKARTIGGNADEEGAYVAQASDGFLFAGSTMSYGFGNFDMYLVKLKSNGSLDFARSYGTNADDRAFEVQPTPDGGAILLGFSTFFGDQDIFLVKTDASGNVIWSKIYIRPKNDHGFSVKPTSDGGYIVAGRTDIGAPGTVNNAVLLLKTDGMGNQQWSFFYDGPGEDVGRRVIETTAASGTIEYVVSGFTNSFPVIGGDDVFLLRVDATGSIIAPTPIIYGGFGDDRAYSLQQASDGGFLMCGHSRSFTAVGSPRVYLIKTDPVGFSGCNEFPVNFGTDNLGFNIDSVLVVESGAILLGGVKFIDFLLNDQVLCENCPPVPPSYKKSTDEESGMFIYPNPADQFIHVDIPSDFVAESSELRVFNILGREVYYYTIASGHTSVQLDISNLTVGSYFLVLKSEKRSVNLRFFVE